MPQCMECDEAITNPVCPECLAEGIAAWAGERLGPAAADAVFDLSHTIAYRHGKTWCIKCFTPMGLCTYCFTKELVSMLEAHPATLAQFLYYFSFDFAKLGYERDVFERFGIDT